MMTISAFTSAVSGLWPWGVITIVTPGTPVAANINIGAQTATATSHPTNSVRQVLLQAGSSNTGLIYLLRKVVGATITKANTNFIVCVVWPGQSIWVPGYPINSSVNPDDYLIDGDTAGNSVILTGYYA
jgi:hypothetical protein